MKCYVWANRPLPQVSHSSVFLPVSIKETWRFSLHKALNILLYFLIIAHTWEAGLLFEVSANFLSVILPFAISGPAAAEPGEQGGGNSTSHPRASNCQAKWHGLRGETRKAKSLSYSPRSMPGYNTVQTTTEGPGWSINGAPQPTAWRAGGSQVRLLMAVKGCWCHLRLGS